VGVGGDARASSADGPSEIVGRGREIAWLTRAVARRRSVVVQGEAGIGKSALLVALGRRLGNRARIVRCLGSLAWCPYMPLRLALGSSLVGDPFAVYTTVRRWLGPDGVLLVDDLHVADEHTLVVVGLLAVRVPVVASARGGAASAAALASARLNRGLLLALAPLDDSALAELARRHHSDLSEDARTELVRRAAGNPLFLQERADDSTFGSVLRARVRELSPRARHTQALLAVLGRPIRIERLPGAIDELVAARLVDAYPDGTVALRHEAMAAASRSLLAESEIAVLSRELAEIVSDPCEAATLWAAAGDERRACELALRAAHGRRDAERAEMLALAATQSPPGLRTELLVSAAGELLDLGEPQRAVRLLGEEPGPDDSAELLGARATALWETGATEAACASAQAVLDRVHEQKPSLRAAALSILAMPSIWSWDPEGARPYVDEVQRIAEQHEEARVEAAFLVAVSTYVSGNVEAALHATRTAYEAASRGFPRDRLRAGEMHANCLFQLGDVAAGVAIVERLMADMRSSRREAAARRLEALMLTFLVSHEFDPARMSRLEALLDEPLPQSTEQFRYFLAALCAQLGLVEDARRLLDHASSSNTSHAAAIRDQAERELALAEGRPEDAMRPLPDGTGLLNATWLEEIRGWAAFSADTSIELGPVASATTLPAVRGAERIVTVLDRVFRGVATTDDVDTLLGAAALLELSQAAPSATRARWGAGELARRLNDGRALELLRAAEAEARERRLPVVHAFAARSLRRLGEPLSRHNRPPPGSLTRREKQVLELVAAGYRSKEIAAQLGISTGTVDKLVGNAMRRLAARTRVHAAATHLAMSKARRPELGVLEPVLVLTAAEAPRRRTSNPTLRLADLGDQILIEAARGEPLTVLLTGDGERDDRFLDDLRKLRSVERLADSPPLSARARRLADLLAEGKSLKAAAEELHVSVRTLEREASLLRAVTGTRSTAEAVRRLLFS
jgi:DNA-binding NarL/FixJ family response regulator